jgi:hypothetical protein
VEDETMKKFLRLLFGILLISGALGAADKKTPGKIQKLSDLHLYFKNQVQQLFGTPMKVKIVVHGRSFEVIPTGSFPKLELELGPFDYQDLRIEKSEFILERIQMDPAALKNRQMKMEKVGDSQMRLVLTLPSLKAKLAKTEGEDLQVKADQPANELMLSGRGRFCFIPAGFASRVGLEWEGRSLFLKPSRVEWAGFKIPRWLWWMGKGAYPKEAVLTLPDGWLPYNVLELHTSWDKIIIATSW